ncbi:hypothetical protein DMC30DRAFT_16655 [Rhodotorula diobovata]|uniref:Uncharacterized protein n=1 Tax=Rhodotorula diobovata TaxID=5288 RepID=A0A5C5FT54_9BASI|nr:hypothetical protein DMC30DRAFT_16655 [Rhodotorula diobovata]
MLALRPAARLVSSSSAAQIPLALSSRLYSSEPANTPAPTPTRNAHEAQSRPRARTLRQVGEDSGSTAQLVALAVKKTQAQGGDTRNRPAAGAGAYPGMGGAALQRAQRPPRQMQRTPEEHREWLKQRLQERKAGAFATGAGSAAPRAERDGSDRRRFNGPRGDGSAPRRPRGDRPPFGSASGPGGSSSSSQPRAAFQPRPQMRRAPRASHSAGPQWPAEATRPLTPPSTVRYPSANLAQLLRADLASKAVQLKCVLGGDKVVNEDADSREERDQAKKVLGGDYSMWLEAGKGQGQAKGKEGVVEHARGILRTNPSVPLTDRQVLLNKIREAVL